MNGKIAEKEKMVYVSLYKKDARSYALTLLATAMQFLYIIIILNSIAMNVWVGATVIINIFLLFFLFTCAVKMNIYQEKWAVRAMLMGAYMLLRQFVLIPVILCPIKNVGVTTFANVAAAVLLIVAGALNISKTERRKKLQAKLAEGNEVKE